MKIDLGRFIRFEAKFEFRSICHSLCENKIEIGF